MTEPYVAEVFIEAPPERVFPYLVQTDLVLRWMGLAARIEPQAGGAYRVEMNGRDIVAGVVVAVEPPTRFAVTWGWEASEAMPPGASTVEFVLEPDGVGTLVRLRHLDLPDDQVDAHAEGWAHFLPRLAVAASGGEPGPDPWAA